MIPSPPPQRYYLSTDLVIGSVATGASGWRIPAGAIEAAVGSAVAARLREPGFLSDVLQLQPVRAGGSAQAHRPHLGVGGPARRPASAGGLEALRLLIVRVELSVELRATASFERLKAAPDAAAVVPALFDFPPFLVVAPLRLRRRGPELRIVLQGAAAPAPKPDPLLLRTLIEARTWVADYLDADRD